MNKKTVIVVVLIILAFALGMLVDNLRLTGNVIGDNVGERYTWTKAICNASNDGTKCLDVVIECEGSIVRSITPISDIRNFSKDWVDPRGDFANEYCLA